MGERATDAGLKAIAEPHRRAILRLVAEDELAAGEIAAAFDVTRTAVSQHLTVLRNAGLVTERRQGTRRLYRARPEGLDGLREFLNEMWAASLDAARQMGRGGPGPQRRRAVRAGRIGQGHAMSQPRGPDQVTAARRPPVRQSTTVRSDLRHTFETFVATIGAWWPVVPFSAGQDRVRDVTVEQRAGGRVYETWADGTELDWGELLAWEPPTRFVMTWTGTPAPTEVEFSFAALGPALTRVTLEHRGWEALTEEQLAEDCALPGGYTSGAYSAGWTRILDRFAAADPGRPPA